MPNHSGRFLQALGALTLLALFIRLAVVLAVFDDRPYFNDEINYFAEAERMLDGAWLGTTTWYAPGPVFFISSGMALGLDRTGLRMAQAVLGAITVFLAAYLAGGLFGRKVGLLVGLVACFYPYLLYIPGVFYSQNQVIPLLLLVVVSLYKRQSGGGIGWLVAAGLSWGVAACFMVPALLTAPPLALWHWFRMRSRSQGFRDAVVLGLVTVLSLVPVTIRNYQLDGKFVFIAAMGGRAFYWANNPDISPKDRDPAKWTEINVNRPDREQAEKGWTTAQMDSALSSRAKAYVREDPVRFLRNYLERVTIMWAFKPHLFTENAHTSSGKYMVAALSSAPIMALALVGMVFFSRRFWRLFPLFLIPILLTFAFSFFHTTVRYRLTFEPILIVFAVAIAVRLIKPAWISKDPGGTFAYSGDKS